MAELEGGKPAAQIAQEHSIHPGLPASGEMNWPRILKERLAAMATGVIRGQDRRTGGAAWPGSC